MVRVSKNTIFYNFYKRPEHFRHHVLGEALLLLLGVELVDLAGTHPPCPTLPLLSVRLWAAIRQ
jgi:hypothetical protein